MSLGSRITQTEARILDFGATERYLRLYDMPGKVNERSDECVRYPRERSLPRAFPGLGIDSLQFV